MKGGFVLSSERMLSTPVIMSHDLPNQPCLIVPNRISLELVQHLEEKLLPHSPICWLVEQNFMPDEAIYQHLQHRAAPGIVFPMGFIKREELRRQLLSQLDRGRYVVYLGGRAEQLHGEISDYPTDILNFLALLKLPITPLYMANYPLWEGVNQGSPALQQMMVTCMPSLPAGEDQATCLRCAWLEASTRQLSELPELASPCIADELLSALLHYSDSCFINGIDDSMMSYDQMLRLALPLARHWRRTHRNCRRLGIILPPGKAAILANLACLIAGISPVNISTQLSAPHMASLVEQAQLTRFVTEERYYQKMINFAWPMPRDLIMMGKEMERLTRRRVRMKLWSTLTQMYSVEQLKNWVDTLPGNGSDEVAMLFTQSEQNNPKAVRISHRMLMAGLMSLYERLPLQTADAVLTAQGFDHHVGFFVGLFYPMMQGCDLITYPTGAAGERLAILCDQYKAKIALTTAQNLRIMTHEAPVDAQHPFSRLSTLLCCGAGVSSSLEQRVHALWGVRLTTSYSLCEAAGLVSLNIPILPPLAEPAAGRYRIPSYQHGSGGRPLAGVALRICAMDSNSPDVAQSPEKWGMLWLMGGKLMGESENDKQAWLRTGDIARFSPEGMLYISGRESRFSQIQNRLVGHDELEEILHEIYQVPNPEERHFAVIAVREKGSIEDRLVMLSRVHESIPTHELLTLKYKLMNLNYHAAWCPQNILYVQRIPELANGQTDIKLCYRYVVDTLGLKPQH